MRKLLVCLLALLCFFHTYSQDKKVIAIMPFVSAVPQNASRASQVQETVIEILKARDDIRFVDRSKDTMVVKELYNQTRLESVSADALAEQGKLLGANEIIVGTLTNAVAEQRRVSSKIPLVGRDDKIKFTASISFSIQIMDVATGAFKEQKVINVNTATEDKVGSILSGKGGGLMMADTEEEAMLNAMKKCKTVVLDWINEVYPPDIHIIKIEETGKSGNPETVLIAGLATGTKKGTVILVNETEMIDAGGGKMIRRTKKIAELKVQSVEDQVTVCKVSDGAKVLGERITSAAKLSFEIK